MTCDHCGQRLQPVHGHYACHTSGCPLFGQNVAPCCQPDAPEEEVIPEHHIRCGTCKLVFDVRELDQVFAHEHTGLREATGIVGRSTP